MEMGTIIAWHKAEGEQVAVGDALYEVENEKSVIAVEAMAPGLLAKIIAPASTEVPVGGAVAVMAEVGSMPTPSEIAELLAGESVGRCAGGRVTRARPGAGAETGEKTSTRKSSAPAPCPRLGRWPRASGWTWLRCRGPVGWGSSPPMMWKGPPPRRALVDPRSGSGVPCGDTPGRWRRPWLATGRRYPTFHRPCWCRRPPSWLCCRSHRAEGRRVSVNDLMVAAVAKACREVPEVNAALSGKSVVIYDEVNVAVGVDTDHGLAAPVVHGAEQMDLEALSAEIRRLADAARRRKLTFDDIGGATITTSNLGPGGVDFGTPIISLDTAATILFGHGGRAPDGGGGPGNGPTNLLCVRRLRPPGCGRGHRRPLSPHPGRHPGIGVGRVRHDLDSAG